MRARATLLLAIALTLWAGVAAAQVVPWHSPFPRARPTQGMSASTPATNEAVREALTGVPAVTGAASSPLAVARSPRPRARPAAAAARYLAGREAEPPPRTEATTPRAAGPSGRGLCGVQALDGSQLATITARTQGCGVTDPVRVTAVGGIPLSQAATMDCETARAFETWVRQSMVPAVGNRGGGINRIQIIGHYSCRPRNNVAGARISEHGRGRAVDVAGYRLANGETVTVADDWRRGPHRRALRRMLDQACGTFRTTLSPESDRHHQDHLHLDMARHRGGGTYCR